MNSEEAKLTIKRITSELKQHSYQYYVLAQPSISDTEFDIMLKKLEALEKEYPQYQNPDSPTLKVGGSITKEFKNIVHKYPMLSLGNTYSEQELVEFDQRVTKAIGKQVPYVCELKFDGLAIGITYKDGKLVQAVTRGDGTKGDDVTENVKTIRSIPHQLKPGDYPDEFEIRGEIFMHRKAFEKMNAERAENGEQIYANPRNFAAGTIKLQDSAEVAKRPLDCYLYFIYADNLPIKSHAESLKVAERWGFPVCQHYVLCETITEALEFIHHWENKRNTLSFDIDGIVIKVDDYNIQNELGFTAKSPRWAISYKYKAQQAETILEKVSYQVGRTGAVTPVANLKPVLLAGTTVKRATLHNANEIERLDLCEGDWVFVEKGGEIIPKIIGVNLAKRKSGLSLVQYPTLCPECQSILSRKEGEAVHYCLNDTDCPPQIIGKIQHFISRKAMNMDGIGDETVEYFYREKLIKSIADLYDLPNKKERLLSLDRFGEKSVTKLLEGLEASKQMPFERVLFGLGIRFVGATVAKKLAMHFKTIDALMTASYDQLIEVDEIGERIAESVVKYFNMHSTELLIKHLRNKGLQLESKHIEKEPQSDMLKDKTFVISGTFTKNSREGLKEIIEENGGKMLSGISTKLNYLVAGENMGPAKLQKANDLNIPIISEDDLLNMLK